MTKQTYKLLGHKDIENLVEREVLKLASILVQDLFEKELLSYDDIENLFKSDKELKDDGFENVDEARDSGEDANEIFEWWFVSEFLYRKLKEKGEPVIDSPYGYLWGRTTTGQAIALDTVIEEIAFEVLA